MRNSMQLVGHSHIYDTTSNWPQPLPWTCFTAHYLLSYPSVSRSIRCAEIM